MDDGMLKIFSNTKFVTSTQDKWNWPFIDIFLLKKVPESTDIEY
jgi:hypothetical protein